MLEKFMSIMNGITTFQSKPLALVQPIGRAARKVHASNALRQAAQSARDPAAFYRAVEANLTAKRDFAAGYQARFPVSRTLGPSRTTGKRAGAGALSAAEFCRSYGFALRTVQRWLEYLDDENFAAALDAEKRALKAEYCEFPGNTPSLRGWHNEEHYTPPAFVESVRAVLGRIDVDPASHPEAQKVIKARGAYTRAEDGLSKPWNGTAFVNPPYTPPLIDRFVAKLMDELTAGRTTAAILLTHDNTDTRWWHTAAAHAQVICFMRGRIKFEPEASPTNGSCFFYFGPDSNAFCNEFGKHGTCLTRSKGFNR